MRKILFVLGLVLCFASCKTSALMVPYVEKSNIAKMQSNMEFIGCKNISRSNFLLKGIGSELEVRGIASDASVSYRGIYSETELATYQSQKRYVTYIDVNQHAYKQNDDVHSNDDLYVAGLVIGGMTVFTLVPVYVPLLCASQKNDCEITLNVDYNIVVFDNITKRNVCIYPVTMDIKDLYTGKFSHRNTNQAEVNAHYRTILFNAILDEYAKAWDYVNTLPQ